jgi:hypothetical protein
MARHDPSKAELLGRGRRLVARWCSLNGVEPPEVVEYPGRRARFGACAYYRSGEIHVWREACAAIGRGGRCWSYPGYVVDRTPYGVLAHELGHHVDRAHGAGRIAGPEWRAETAEKPLTGYCPNDNEWFAELFRLYVTNPDLLRLLRPRVFVLLAERWPRQAEARPWVEVLAGADRQIRAAENKIRRAA